MYQHTCPPQVMLTHNEPKPLHFLCTTHAWRHIIYFEISPLQQHHWVQKTLKAFLVIIIFLQFLKILALFGIISISPIWSLQISLESSTQMNVMPQISTPQFAMFWRRVNIVWRRFRSGVVCVFQVLCFAQVREGTVEVTVTGLKATDTDIYRCEIEVFYPPPYLRITGNGTLIHVLGEAS